MIRTKNIVKKIVALLLVLVITMECGYNDNHANMSTVYAAGKKPSVKISSVNATDKALTVKWKLSNAKKSKIQKGEIKVSSKKSMPKSNAKTYTLSKKQAKKLSYQLTVKSGKIKKDITYYFKIRLKVSGKWTAWSGKKSGKVKAKKDDDTDDDKNNLDNYKCKHTLKTGWTSTIVSANGTVFDVHTNANEDVSGFTDIFQIYVMKWYLEGKKGVYSGGIGDDPIIDYSKLKFVFDNGKSGELWDWMEKSGLRDIEGYGGWIYSVPNYTNAIADVYLNVPRAYKTSCIVTEETVPHKVDSSYTVSLKYDGVVIATAVRNKKACINKAIQLFQTYGGEAYVKAKLDAGGTYCEPFYVDEWQSDTFNYYGCQNGVHMEMSIVRYFYPGYKMMVCEIVPSADKLNSDFLYTVLNQVQDTQVQQTAYAPRYKQHGWNVYGNVHVFYEFLIPGTNNVWGDGSLTGSFGENSSRVTIPMTCDFEKLIYK